MKFNYIDKAISVEVADRCRYQFRWLTTELGVREDNCHVGTGLGGNNFQLVTMFGLKHRLSASTKTEIHWSPKKNRLVYGAEWFANAKRVDIRHKLDEVFPSIVESRKYLSLAISELSGLGHLRTALEKYKDQFPQLMACLNGETYTFDDKLTNVEKLLLASIMCQDLARDLDAGSTKKVQYIGSALYQFPSEIILLAIRRYIQIDRLVKHNMDEDPVFLKTLEKVTKVVDR